MKRKTMILAVMAIAVVLLLCGCGGKNSQTATLALPSNATTGYEWSAFQNEDLFEINKEYAEDSHAEGMVGVGGTTTFTLVPLKSGECKVSFVYMRPWEGVELGDSYTFDITVSEDLQITVNTMTTEIGGVPTELPEIPDMVIQ